MTTVTARRHNPVIRACHTTIVPAGQTREVALVAAMRKLLLILNAVIRDRILWQPNRVSAAGEA